MGASGRQTPAVELILVQRQPLSPRILEPGQAGVGSGQGLGHRYMAPLDSQRVSGTWTRRSTVQRWLCLILSPQMFWAQENGDLGEAEWARGLVFIPANHHHAVWPWAFQLPSLGHCFPICDSATSLDGHCRHGLCFLGWQWLTLHR